MLRVEVHRENSLKLLPRSRFEVLRDAT